MLMPLSSDTLVPVIRAKAKISWDIHASQEGAAATHSHNCASRESGDSAGCITSAGMPSVASRQMEIWNDDCWAS